MRKQTRNNVSYPASILGYSHIHSPKSKTQVLPPGRFIQSTAVPAFPGPAFRRTRLQFSHRQHRRTPLQTPPETSASAAAVPATEPPKASLTSSPPSRAPTNPPLAVPAVPPQNTRARTPSSHLPLATTPLAVDCYYCPGRKSSTCSWST